MSRKAEDNGYEARVGSSTYMKVARSSTEDLAHNDAQKLRQSLGELPEPIARPFLIVMSGLPGTGKSYFSRRLTERLPCVRLESDELRKVLFPSPGYSADENQRLFSALHWLIQELLRKNIPVLLDATNLVEHHREQLYCIADRLGAKLVLVRVEAPPEVVRERLQTRMASPHREDNSEADFSVYQRMKQGFHKIRRRHFAVDTSRDITPVLEKIVREARR